jgi:hypothetical protein
LVIAERPLVARAVEDAAHELLRLRTLHLAEVDDHLEDAVLLFVVHVGAGSRRRLGRSGRLGGGRFGLRGGGLGRLGRRPGGGLGRPGGGGGRLGRGGLHRLGQLVDLAFDALAQFIKIAAERGDLALQLGDGGIGLLAGLRAGLRRLQLAENVVRLLGVGGTHALEQHNHDDGEEHDGDRRADAGGDELIRVRGEKWHLHHW